MIIHWDIEQNTDEWHEVKAGKFSASSAAKLMAGTSTKGFNDLIKTVAWGRVHGASGEPHYMSGAMKRGHELEPDARNWYAFTTGNQVKQCGFVEADNGLTGWSPDGLIMNDDKITGAIEIKCLLHKAYMDVLDTGKPPNEYKWQMQFALRHAGLDEMDFVAYHPAAGGIVLPVAVDQEMQQQITKRLVEAEKLVAGWIEKLTGGVPKKPNQPEYEINF